MNHLVRSTKVVTQKCTCPYHRNVRGTFRRFGDKRPMYEPEKEKDRKNGAEELNSCDDLTEPTNCCMSGCVNCVWIQYAERLSNALQKSDVDVQKIIIEKIEDPNMKAFLSMELRCRNLIK